MAMLKFRSRPLRAGSLQDVLGGATKSSHVMLSGLTQFCGSRGANGVVGALVFRSCAGKADAGCSIAAARTTIETGEWPFGAIVAVVQDSTSNDELGSQKNQVDRSRWRQRGFKKEITYIGPTDPVCRAATSSFTYAT